MSIRWKKLIRIIDRNISVNLKKPAVKKSEEPTNLTYAFDRLLQADAILAVAC